MSVLSFMAALAMWALDLLVQQGYLPPFQAEK
jgi:hypothetical protein